MEEEKIQLTLSPEPKNTGALFDGVPIMQSVVSKSESNYSAGTIDESMLSEEEKAMVEQFASEIDIENVDQIVNYGIKAQTNISEFSTTILKKVKTYDLGEVGESLKELTVALDATTEPEKKGFLGIFQKAKRGVGSIRANYAKSESNVDRIEKDLIKHRDVLGQDISMYQQMYELNVQYYKELTMYIIAGKKALDHAKSTKLEQLKIELENKLLTIEDKESKEYIVTDSDIRIIDIILNPVKPELWLDPSIDDFYKFDNSKDMKHAKVKNYKHMGKLPFKVTQ